MCLASSENDLAFCGAGPGEGLSVRPLISRDVEMLKRWLHYMCIL